MMLSLSSYMTRLLSKGQVVFSSAQAQQALGIAKGALLDAAEKQQRKRHLFKPRRDFYVIVPPQFLTWGAPPPSWYIDALMRHERQPYYVGLLKAAELHGATHQAVMAFQVVTNKRLPQIKAGRSVLTFHYRKDMSAITTGLVERKTDTGTMKLSCIELTVFDLLRYPRAAGGINHIATVLSDLGDNVDPKKLAVLAAVFPRATSQRLGYMLCCFGYEDKAAALSEILVQGSGLPWVELEPALATDPDFTPTPTARDKCWRVVVRRPPEPDT